MSTISQLSRPAVEITISPAKAHTPANNSDIEKNSTSSCMKELPADCGLLGTGYDTGSLHGRFLRSAASPVVLQPNAAATRNAVNR